jgi:raffinose/stachyose/melibiose transport system substrate-binding protein
MAARALPFRQRFNAMASPRTDSSAKYTIQFWNGFNNSEEQNIWTKYYVTEWNAKYPNTPINLVVKPAATLLQLQQTALEAGGGGDIISQGGTSGVIPLATAGLLLPLNDYSDKYHWKDLILPWAFEASTYNGQLWSLPSYYETMLQYYNATLFAEHGWKPPTTLAECEELFPEMLGKGVTPIAAGNASYRAISDWFTTIIWNHYSGPDALYQALTGQIPWTDPVFVDAIAILQRWFQNKWIATSPENYFTTQANTVFESLSAGKAGMYWSGTWDLSSLPIYFGKLAHNTKEWGWTQLPQLRPEIPPVLNELSVGGTYSINKKSGDPDVVAEYLTWYFANKTAAVIGMKLFGEEPPPLFFKPSDWLPGTNPLDSRAYNELATNSQAGNVGYTDWTFMPPKSDTYVWTDLDGVILGSTTPKAYCQGLQSIFKKELAAGQVPPLFKPRAYAKL